MKYDLFISYARKDNEPDWLSGFIEMLKARHREFTDRELSVAGEEGGHNTFLDVAEILSGDQWRLRILTALQESAFMLAVVSPNYFASAACREEFETFVAREFERLAVGEAISPIYWIEVPGFPDRPSGVWQEDLAKRNILPRVPLRKWDEGLEEALRVHDIQEKLGAHMDAIAATVRDRIERRDRALASPTNLDGRVSPQFVGRSRELVALHESLKVGAVGAITSVQGIGGIGKSELAFAYAVGYAHEYPGGRWLVACEGKTDVQEALADAMGIPWSIPARSADMSSEMRWAQFLRALDAHGKTLFVLDNVSEPTFLSRKRLQSLPAKGRAAFLVTTRLGFDPLPGEFEVLDLDRLETRDGIALLRRFRASTPKEEEILRDIVEQVGGHALALEVIGIHMYANPVIGWSDYKAWFDQGPLTALGSLADRPGGNETRHGEVLVSELLQPTFERLAVESPLAMEAARVAGFLPPDAVYEPWLRAIVIGDRKQLLYRPNPGTVSPWEAALQALQANLLVRFSPRAKLGATGRMHRIVGSVLRAMGPDRQSETSDTIGTIAREHRRDRPDVRPDELSALEAWADSEIRISSTGSAQLTIHVARLLATWGRHLSARSLLEKLLNELGDRSAPDWINLKAATLDAIGDSERNLGKQSEALARFNSAQILLRGPGAAGETGDDYARNRSVVLNKIGDIHFECGRKEEALRLYQDSLDARRRAVVSSGRSEESLRDLIVGLSKLGKIALTMGNRDEALEHYGRALSVAYDVVSSFGESRRSLDDLSLLLGKVGACERDLGQRESALRRFRLSLEMCDHIIQIYGRSPETMRSAMVATMRLAEMEK